MTVTNTEEPPKHYTCNGVTTDFPITFDYVAESHLTVYHVATDDTVTTWVQDAAGAAGYTIVLGEVIANTAPASGTLVIDGETPQTQEVDLKNNRATPAETYESALDKLTIMARDLAAKISRAFVASPTDSEDTDYTLPGYSASKYLQWHPTSQELRNADIAATGTNTVGTDVGDLVKLVDDGAGNGVIPSDQLNLIDEDDMVSDSAVKAPSQQSSKAYTDALHIIQRALFEYKDTDEIYLSAGRYFHSGTVKKNIHWDSKLTYAFTGLAVSAWRYLYLDDSAIVTLDSDIITASQLTESASAPTWNVAKGGWYHPTTLTNDMCIGAVLTNGSSEILAFWHDGGDYVQYDVSIEDSADQDIDASWEDIPNLSIPGFSTKAKINFTGNENGGGVAYFSVRPEGSSGAGLYILRMSGNTVRPTSILDVITSSTQEIEGIMNTGGVHTITTTILGWHFPKGM